MTRNIPRSVGAFAMETNFKVFMLFGMCAFASLADAATTTFDLRTAPKSPSARLLSASAGSCLQTATLPAGATAAGALSVGDTLAFLLFKDTEIHITLSERMESPLGGEAFIGTVSGYDGVKNAVVLQTADGLTVDIQDFARNRTYTIVSDANGVTVKEIDPSRDVVTPTAPVDPGIQSDRSGTMLSASLEAERRRHHQLRDDGRAEDEHGSRQLRFRHDLPLPACRCHDRQCDRRHRPRRRALRHA